MTHRTFCALLALGIFVTAGITLSCRANHSTKAAQQDPSAGAEFYAWEKTPQGEYKQVKKDYFMNEELCKNVIGVLNDMSTTAPRSNWVLSHTTNSTSECWPAKIDPNEYRKKYSAYSDDPSVAAGARRK